MTTPRDKNLEILDAIYNDVALVDAEDGDATPEDRRWAGEVRNRVQARLAELRRNLLPAEAPPRPAKPIRAKYLAMARDALLSAVDEITQRMGGTVQVAHRNLSGLSDDDLRRLLETLDPDPE